MILLNPQLLLTSSFVCTSDCWFMTTATCTSTTMSACPLVLLIIYFLVWTFFTILFPVIFELRISDHLASEPCLNKDNILCILPVLHLVPYSDVTYPDSLSQDFLILNASSLKSNNNNQNSTVNDVVYWKKVSKRLIIANFIFFSPA